MVSLGPRVKVLKKQVFFFVSETHCIKLLLLGVLDGF